MFRSQFAAFLLSLAILLTGCGTGNNTVPTSTANLEGTWSGEYETNLIGTTEFTMDLVQDGKTLSGFFHSAEFEGGLSGEITQLGADLKLTIHRYGETGTIDLVIQLQNSSLEIVSITGSDGFGYHETGTGTCGKKPQSTVGGLEGMVGKWAGQIYLQSDTTPAQEDQSIVASLSYKGNGIYSGQITSEDVAGVLTMRQNGSKWDVVFVETKGADIVGTFYTANGAFTNTGTNKLEFIEISLKGTRKSTGSEKITCLINLMNYDPKTFLEGTWNLTDSEILCSPSSSGTLGSIITTSPISWAGNGSLSLKKTDLNTYSGTFKLSLLGFFGNNTDIIAPIEMTYTGNMFNLNWQEGKGFLANISVVGPLVVSGPRDVTNIVITPIYIGSNPTVMVTSLVIFEENRTNMHFIKFQK